MLTFHSAQRQTGKFSNQV